MNQYLSGFITSESNSVVSHLSVCVYSEHTHTHTHKLTQTNAHLLHSVDWLFEQRHTLAVTFVGGHLFWEKVGLWWTLSIEHDCLIHSFHCSFVDLNTNILAMANRNAPTSSRPNGAPQGKICQFKLVLLGESAVGKSSLVLRFVKGQFHEYQESTIGGLSLLSIWSIRF